MPNGRPAVQGAPGRPNRRALLRASAAAAAAAALGAHLPPALAATDVDLAVAELLAGRRPGPAPRLDLDLPARFDYGNTVPLTVRVDSPMTAADHVRCVSVFAAGNPFPAVASLHFTPTNGRASASTRIRLNEGTQAVVAVAELSDGRALLARRAVQVSISGCSAASGVVLGYAMPRPEPRIKVPAAARRGEIVEVRTMISHWMETGLRTDAAGAPIPRRIVDRMVCRYDGEPVFTADLTPAIAANAFLNFHLLARGSGVLAVTWHEDGGAEYHASHALTVA